MRRLAARTGLRPPTIALAVILLVGLTSVAVVTTVLRSIDRNREGIEVSCLLIVQTIRDSGANSNAPAPTAAAEASRRIADAYRVTLLDLMPPKRRARVLRDVAIVRAAGGSIPEPQCDEAAADPAKIRRQIIQKRRIR